MKTRITDREAFSVCGYAIETNLEDNNNDISKLYAKFQNEGYDSILKKLPGCETGYYGLEWYTEGHKSFYYLLGKSVGKTAVPPKEAILKHIPASKYIVAEIPAEANIVDAWTEFFYQVIPESGYEIDDAHGYYFEYYRNGMSGDCELWTPVKQ